MWGPHSGSATPDPAALRVRFWCLQSLGNLSFLLFSLRDLWPYSFALMSSRLHLALKTIPVSEQLCSVSPHFLRLSYAWQCESVNLKYLRMAFWSMEHSLKSIPPKWLHYYYFELLNSMWERTVKIVLKMFRSKIPSITDHERTSYHEGCQRLLIRWTLKHLGPTYLFMLWTKELGK